MRLLPNNCPPRRPHMCSFPAHSFSMSATLTLSLWLVCGFGPQQKQHWQWIMQSNDAKEEPKKVLVEESRIKKIFWVIPAECYSDAKFKHLFVVSISLLLFQFCALPIKWSPEGTWILQYFVNYNVTLNRGTIFFKNSVIRTVVLQPDKLNFCLFSVMIGMVRASLPVQTHPEPAP